MTNTKLNIWKLEFCDFFRGFCQTIVEAINLDLLDACNSTIFDQNRHKTLTTHLTTLTLFQAFWATTLRKSLLFLCVLIDCWSLAAHWLKNLQFSTNIFYCLLCLAKHWKFKHCQHCDCFAISTLSKLPFSDSNIQISAHNLLLDEDTVLISWSQSSQCRKRQFQFFSFSPKIQRKLNLNLNFIFFVFYWNFWNEKPPFKVIRPFRSYFIQFSAFQLKFVSLSSDPENS